MYDLKQIIMKMGVIYTGFIKDTSKQSKLYKKARRL